MLSLACGLKKARTKAPKDRIAPGNFGSWVPPSAEPKIKIPNTINMFSMEYLFTGAKIKHYMIMSNY